MAISGLKEKFLGGMVGSALGDAIGELAFAYPQEARLRSRVDRIGELRYTDDTAMAIGLAESIIASGGIDPQHLGKTFSENFCREPWRGYAAGPPTVFSIAKQRKISYVQAAKTLFGGNGSLGNGAAMRIVPVGLFFCGSSDIYEQACASAQVTHAHPMGMDGAAVQALAVAQAVKLDPRAEFPLETFSRRLVDFGRTREIQEKMRFVYQSVLQGIASADVANTVGRSVAVHESMPFAVFSFLRSCRSFEDCLFCAVLNGGDRDTLGAMAGGISGAYLGLQAIPLSWREKLEGRDYITSLASRLAEIFPG